MISSRSSLHKKKCSGLIKMRSVPFSGAKMAEDATEALTAGIAALDLKQPTEEKGTSSQRPIAQGRRQVTVKIPSQDQSTVISAEQTQPSSSNSNDTAKAGTPRLRKDSHSDSTHDNPTTSLQEVASQQSQLESLLLENERLRKEKDVLGKRWKEEISRIISYDKHSREKESELAACKKELECVNLQNQQLQFRATIEQINLDLDGICYKKARQEDKSMEVTVTATFSKIITFPAKQWGPDVNPNINWDDGAIAIVSLFGRLCASKCGKRPETCSDFIDHHLWTDRAIELSKLVGPPLERKWAMHAEPQLIAFYITRFLGSAGFSMMDFDNPQVYKECPETDAPVTIYVSQEVCYSCKKFVDSVNRFTGKCGLRFDPVKKRVAISSSF
jgi:hypothetical protein